MSPTPTRFKKNEVVVDVLGNRFTVTAVGLRYCYAVDAAGCARTLPVCNLQRIPPPVPPKTTAPTAAAQPISPAGERIAKELRQKYGFPVSEKKAL